jgi:hypothetical protein
MPQEFTNSGEFKAFIECMPPRLRSADGPRWFRTAEERQNWPRFLRRIVENVVTVADEDDPDCWDKLTANPSLQSWSRALAGISLDHLRGLLASRPAGADRMRTESSQQQVRRAFDLFTRLNKPAPGWLDLLGPTGTQSATCFPTDEWFEQAPAWLRSLAFFDDQAFSAYTLPFPVVDPDDTKKKAHVIDAVVTLCPCKGSSERADPVSVTLAPWSLLDCDPSALRDLRAAFNSMLEADKEHFGFLRGRNVLLELRPAEVKTKTELLPLPGDTIEGTSLGLGVLLACWAAERKPLFRHLMLTGAVDTNGITYVSEVKAKFGAACDYAADLGRNFVFLAPRESQEARALVDNDRLVRIKLISTWKSLFDIIPDHLTDGYDGYRERLAATPASWPSVTIDNESPDDFGVWNSTDDVDIQALIKRLLARDPPRSDFLVVPFGNDPGVVARHVVGMLCKEIRDGASKAERSAGETLVPVLVPLGQVDPKRDHALDEAVIEGIRSWSRAGVATTYGSSGEWPSDALLRTTIRSYPQLLMLVIYGQESRQAPSFDEQRARLDCLFQQWSSLPKALPRMVLIASDEHHRRALEPVLRSFAESLST